MKTKVRIETEVEIKHVLIDIHCRHIGGNEGDLPPDFPLLDGEQWKAKVEIDTGKIVDWPADAGERELHVKACDEGTYSLIDAGGKVIASIEQGYVPSELIPGEYGDYVHLKISADGVITNWPSHPGVSEFFGSDDD
jgi:hypothetical protein